MMKRHGTQKIPTFFFSLSANQIVVLWVIVSTQTYIHTYINTPSDGLSGIWTVNGVIGFYNLVDITCTMSRFAPLQYCIFFFDLMNLLVAPNCRKSSQIIDDGEIWTFYWKQVHLFEQKAIELKMLTFSRILVQFYSSIRFINLQLKIFIKIDALIEMISISENASI